MQTVYVRIQFGSKLVCVGSYAGPGCPLRDSHYLRFWVCQLRRNVRYHVLRDSGQQTQSIAGRPEELYLTAITPTEDKNVT